jgi:hypothetical protein
LPEMHKFPLVVNGFSPANWGKLKIQTFYRYFKLSD